MNDLHETTTAGHQPFLVLMRFNIPSSAIRALLLVVEDISSGWWHENNYKGVRMQLRQERAFRPLTRRNFLSRVSPTMQRDLTGRNSESFESFALPSCNAICAFAVHSSTIDSSLRPTRLHRSWLAAALQPFACLLASFRVRPLALPVPLL